MILKALHRVEYRAYGVEYATKCNQQDERHRCVSQEDGLQEEKIYLEQAYAITQRLTDVLAEHQQVILQRETLYGVLKQYMRSATIPFRGEPLDGLQVMGLLETRALDFKKVIILAANEGYLPRMQNANSFIPYNLRKGYGLYQ